MPRTGATVSPAGDAASRFRRFTAVEQRAAASGVAPWIERKNRVVRRFGHSSFYMGVSSEGRFNEMYLLDESEFAAHGGAFPVIVRGVGVVGTVTVSGLPQEEDHRLVVSVLRAFLASR